MYINRLLTSECRVFNGMLVWMERKWNFRGKWCAPLLGCLLPVTGRLVAIWLSWNPVEFSRNWDFLVTTFLEENIEGTISCIPFCFPVESSLLFWALPSHKGLHLSPRSKGFALVSSGCCAAKSDGPSALLWEFWTFVTCPCLKCGFSIVLDVQLDGGWGFVSLLLVELKQPY